MADDAEHLRAYPYEPGDVVVGLQHLRLVISELNRLNIPLASSPEVSELLGLARLALADVPAAARAVVAAVNNDDSARERLTVFQQPRGDLEQFLWGFRGLMAAKCGGWMPTLAKNRLVGRVHGVGNISHGSGDDPKPFKPDPPLANRATGPGRGVRVGVLDTQLYPQDWLAGGWAARYSDTLSDDAPLFSAGHATFVAGLILMQAPGATVEVRQVLGSDGTADSWTVAQKIVLFGRSGLDVLNLSFLCHSADGQPPTVLSAAIDRLDPELVVVAAAGNHGDLRDANNELLPQTERVKPAWPAAFDDVTAVGACDRQGRRAAFTPPAPWIDLYAPGIQVGSTFLASARSNAGAEPTSFGGYARWSGTSFAAALVSGAIAAGIDPGRISGQDALRNIFDTLEHRSAPTPAGAESMYLHLPTI